MLVTHIWYSFGTRYFSVIYSLFFSNQSLHCFVKCSVKAISYKCSSMMKYLSSCVCLSHLFAKLCETGFWGNGILMYICSNSYCWVMWGNKMPFPLIYQRKRFSPQTEKKWHFYKKCELTLRLTVKSKKWLTHFHAFIFVIITFTIIQTQVLYLLPFIIRQKN